MFGNFIYFIVALLIYSTYQPSEQTNFSPLDTLALFFSLILLFFIFSRRQFVRIARMSATHSHDVLDQQFSSAVTRQSILAIALFAVDIYGLNISSFLTGIWLFEAIPTVEALVFMAFFVGYLAMVWSNAYDAYRRIYQADLTRKAYVGSNISFSVPVLLPWLLLSGIADLILALPFDLPRQVLTSPEGETAYFLFFLFAVAVLGPLIIQKFWRCRPLEAGYFRQRIEALCRRANLKYADILYWPIFGGRMITAGVMGLVSRFRYILVTDALLRILSPEELDAVIAHEVGHVKKRHLLFYLFFFIGYMVIAYATFDLIVYLIIFSEPIYRFVFMTGISRTTVTTGLLSLAIIFNFLVYFRFIFGFFMRNFERQADAFVYSLFASALPLISTFEKIVAVSGHSPDKPNWHHFSIRQRVDFLKRCEVDRSWVQRHDRKVRTSIAIYMAAMVVVGIAGYQLNFGQTGKRLNEKFFETAILNEISRNGESNAGLYGMLGDLYFGRSSFGQAASAYRIALDINPDSAIVLNNYAWLLATCEDPAYRNQELALELAFKAAAIEQSPHILDTLAESLFVNGQIVESIDTATTALEMAKTNRAYYSGQLEKFQAARDNPITE
ncbi:MAG: M48 family metalloprotease [Desulfosarcina sp.]|nr:M48 family metalloprotease [Desulfosarcina sp.]MBC2741689.1 M48 family metalloprotease [Desulfosarcina sp.]MBC2764603.1 M48 family metalloprotease [Desulfosarcina sp.]